MGSQAERLRKEQQEEEEFRKSTLERLAEENRVEQLNSMKRRCKIAEHMREVDRLVEQKRAMYAAARVRSFRALSPVLFMTYPRQSMIYEMIEDMI